MSAAPLPEAQLQAMADRLATIARIERPKVTSTSGRPPRDALAFVYVRQPLPEDGLGTIVIHDEWFVATRNTLICQCHHSNKLHTPDSDGCSLCHCDTFADIGQPTRALQERSIEALIAHEVGHIKHPPPNPATQLVAEQEQTENYTDSLGAIFLGDDGRVGHGQMALALRFTDTAVGFGGGHLSNESRAKEVLRRFA